MHLHSVFLLLAMTAAAAAAEPPPGGWVTISPDALAAPGATPSAGEPPEVVKRPANAALHLPPGFSATLFADGLDHARWLATAPNGDVFLAESQVGKITILRDSDGSGHAGQRFTFADGFDMPHGMAFRPGFLYVADVRGVWRLPYQPGQTQAQGKPEAVTAPGALDGGHGHWTRDILFTPQGDRFYVAVGSGANLEEEPAPRATIQLFNADGSQQRSYATGMRNAVGVAIRPGTDELWAVVNERDGLGDDLVPDYLTHVQDGGFYGWPYAYLGNHPQPGALGTKRPDLVARAIVPDLLFRSHSAPLGLVFYDGTQFPPEYRGDAFVALHGSWNSSKPTGYMVVRVHFDHGKPGTGYQVFATGFRLDTGDKAPARVWGRPVGLAVAADGSLLVADDTGQSVWRITYGR